MPGATVSNLAESRILANTEIAPGIFLLSFPRSFDFVPGQSISITVAPSLPPRIYSIASGNRESTVDVLYDLVAEGELTPRLAPLRAGATVLVSAPFGSFRDFEGPSCWVAGGTGVAPFVSMVRSGVVREKLLIQGSRTISGLLYRGLFTEALGERHFPCCSRETAHGVFRGRPTEWLTEQPLPPAQRYLLCGSSRMVVDARDIIIGKGVPFANVLSEIYF